MKMRSRPCPNCGLPMEEGSVCFTEGCGEPSTRCAGSDLAVGVTGDAYDPVETFPCPGCGQEVPVYTDHHTVRLRDHLRAVA